jgi:hypothetical protein
MTQEEIFLAWCKKHGIKYKTRKSGPDGICYNINPDHKAVIVVQGVTLKLNKEQESDHIHVYFNNGEWSGGTNTIWNTGLPWEGR